MFLAKRNKPPVSFRMADGDQGQDTSLRSPIELIVLGSAWRAEMAPILAAEGQRMVFPLRFVVGRWSMVMVENGPQVSLRMECSSRVFGEIPGLIISFTKADTQQKYIACTISSPPSPGALGP
jgi:hypothetical protein